MATYGETLFGGSAFVRWTLTPFVFLFAVLMPFLIPGWTSTAAAITVGIEIMCLALLAGFWLPARFGRWALRALAGLVFLAYFSYLLREFFFSEAPFKLVEARSKASPRNALLGFALIGLPWLWFSLVGRFTLRAETSRALYHQNSVSRPCQLLPCHRHGNTRLGEGARQRQRKGCELRRVDLRSPQGDHGQGQESHASYQVIYRATRSLLWCRVGPQERRLRWWNQPWMPPPSCSLIPDHQLA